MKLWCQRCEVKDDRWKRIMHLVYVSDEIAVNVYRHQGNCGGLAARPVRVRIAAA